jgi:hypothetical protein
VLAAPVVFADDSIVALAGVIRRAVGERETLLMSPTDFVLAGLQANG